MMIDMVYKHINFNFSNKIVLVSGGSRGIGLGLVKSFLDSGAEVFYLSRNPISDPEIKGAKHISVDLNDDSKIKNAFSLISEYADVDILINSAAINFSHKFENISSKEWDKVLNLNLRSVFILTRLVIKGMKKNKAGKIVNISSIAGRHRSLVSGTHYVASKAALIGLTKQLAYEVGEFNINVNAVCPSQTATDMLLESMSDEQQKNLIENIPLKRIANIKDQVGPILFLCSDAARYITGTFIDVNGGQI